MPHVTVERSDGVAVLTVDRPPANALDVGLLQELIETVEQLRTERPAALVVSGREGFFSAGADLKAMPGYGPADRRTMVDSINAMALAVYALPFPVVGAITGHAIAGGLVLALCTDLRVASSAGRYGLTEVKVDVPYPQAAIGVVAAELAPQAARRLAFGNELLDGAECLRLGVFDEVLGPSAVFARAAEIAGELARFPAETYARTKRDLRGAVSDRLAGLAARDPLLEASAGAAEAGDGQVGRSGYD